MEGEVNLDMVSLFPQKTFKNRKNGMRADLAQAIADIRPRFVRFPGGCVAHGNGLDNIYRWENTIGEQGMNWINVAQKKGGGFDPTALYAVSSIPANFLISPEGKIVAKNLRGEHLEEKLAEVLK